MKRRGSVLAAVCLMLILGVALFCTDTFGADVEVSILYPNSGESFELGEPIYFSGEGTYVETGIELSGNELVWFSNLDGTIGKGKLFSTTSLSPGHHRIMLIGKDEAIDAIEIDVIGPVAPPSERITSGDYATYDMAKNLLYIPFMANGSYYWINMEVTAFGTPFELQVVGMGPSTFSPTASYATFNILTNTLHVPAYIDRGNSYWFDLKMTGTTPPYTFELVAADTN